MFVYLIKVEYLGTNFVGWQIQKNGLSIQEVLQKVFLKFFKRKIIITGSGRTDAGVHASEQSAHFKTKNTINNKGIFLNSVNFFLKKFPVSILNIQKPVPPYDLVLQKLVFGVANSGLVVYPDFWKKESYSFHFFISQLSNYCRW